MPSFDSLNVVGELKPVADAEVSRAEAQFGSRFPHGYREFVTRFGAGVLGGLIRIYTPVQMMAGHRSVAEWRERIREDWFWEQGARLLTQERALECIVIGDTVGADEIVFHPSAPDVLYVLPHDSDEIHRLGQGLEPALNWFFTSGVIDAPFEDNSFEPD